MLIDRLKKIESYPFHMPGHKRNTELFKYDFTEIAETDDLHHPSGILKEQMERAAEFYGTRFTRFLVNGSTCGILAAICALTKEGESILIAKNCHKSVYNAVLLKGLLPHYICPEVDCLGIYGGISPKRAEAAIKLSGARVFVMTSPTYEGVVSDIKAISLICHRLGCVLIVDEAHGAHFNFYDKLPASAVGLGADIVIQSLHKTLPSLTQTGVLHICTQRIDEREVFKYLSIFESSSPSYLLLASADCCIEFMSGESGKRLFDDYWGLLTDFRSKAEGHILGREVIGQNHIFDLDPTRLVILGGKAAADAVKAQSIELEAENIFYSIAISSVGDTKEGFDRLASAIDSLPVKRETGVFRSFEPKVILTPREAESREFEEIPIDKALGRTAKAPIYIYPPGIPVVNSGEEITSEALELITAYKANGLRVIGAENNKISAIK